MEIAPPQAIAALQISWMDIATLLAILVGPLLALIVTWTRDKRREDRARKLNLFQSLLRTRSTRLDPLHVSSLNVVELEFYGNDTVLVPFRNYIRHLSDPMPLPDEQDRFFEARNDLFLTFMAAMGASLNFKFDKHDLGRLAYAPMGWDRDETQQRRNAALLTDLLEGKRALPVTSMQPRLDNPFPPPPAIEKP